jgi:hypothetical protein
VQNLKTLANQVWRPRPDKQAAAYGLAHWLQEDLGGRHEIPKTRALEVMVVPGPISESYSLGLLLGFTFLAGCFFLAVSGATGVGTLLSTFGELFGGTVSEGSAFNACDG